MSHHNTKIITKIKMRHMKVFGPERVEDEVFSLANWGSNKALALIQYSSWVIILNIFLQKLN